MKIYKISQEVNNGYDTYDSMVVCAESAEKAKRIHPSSVWVDGGFYDEEKKRVLESLLRQKTGDLFI